MKFTEIVLDLDGPLLEGSKKHYACYSSFILQKGLQPISAELYWRQKREGINRNELLKQSKAEALYDEFLQFWLENIETFDYLELDELQLEVHNILRSWKEKNIKLYLITMRRNNEALIRQLIDKKLRSYFDAILTVGINAPAEGKAKAAASVIANKEQTLWIGDTEVDILAAQSLHIEVCAVSNGLRDTEFLKKFAPNYLKPSLKDFFYE